MSLQCLLFSHDERSVRLLRLSLGDLSVGVEHCTDLEGAQKLLLLQKFDGVVSDCALSNGPELLQTVRKSKHNRRSIIFALAGEQIKMSAAFQMGADFIIYKPLSAERVKRTLHAAHGLMMREKRMHFRHPASTPVMLNPRQRPMRVELCDLTAHGALINTGFAIKKGQLIEMVFTLPETKYELDVTARVTRSDPLGKTGVKFESISEVAQRRLTEWAMERAIDVPKSEPAPSQAAVATPKATEAPPTAELPSDVEFAVEVVGSENYDLEARHRAMLRGQHHASMKILRFDNGMPVIVPAKCRNISELGLAAKVDEELGIDEPVLLQVELPGAPKPIVLHASVRRQEDELYGFEFVGVNPAVRDLLRQCINDLPVE